MVLIFKGDAGSGLKDQNHIGVAQDLWEADASLSAMVIPNVLTRITHDNNPAHFAALGGLGYSFGFNMFDFIDDVVEQTGGEVVYSDNAGAARKEEPLCRRVSPNQSLDVLTEERWLLPEVGRPTLPYGNCEVGCGCWLL